MHQIKSGASLSGLHEDLEAALGPAEEAYAAFDADLVITSGTEEGAPHSPTSLHWEGRAVDLRIKNVPSDHRQCLSMLLEEKLGEAFHVKLEATTGTAPHIHLSLPERPEPEAEPKPKRRSAKAA